MEHSFSTKAMRQIYELAGLVGPLAALIWSYLIESLLYLHCTKIMNNNIQRRRSNVGLMTSSLLQTVSNVFNLPMRFNFPLTATCVRTCNNK